MRVLFVSSSFPGHLSISNYKSIGGVQRRQDMLIRAIKEIAQIDVLFYVSSDFEVSSNKIEAIQRELSHYWETPINLFLCPKYSLPRWRQRLEGLISYKSQGMFLGTSGPKQIKAFEACLGYEPDVIFIQRLQSAYPIKATRLKLPPIIYDVDDVEHLKLIRQIWQKKKSLRTLISSLYVSTLKRGECNIIRSVDKAFVCSDEDRTYFDEQVGIKAVKTISNALSIPTMQPLTTDPNLFLIGSYKYPPNVEAASFLIEKVFPIVRRHCPNAHLIIAGGNPERISSYFAKPKGVEFTGFVDDLEALYHRAKIVCCPVFNGGGTRIKTIEAAAYGKSIVATEIGVEGLNLLPSRDYLLSNTAQTFAASCIKLLQEHELALSLAKSAYRRVAQNYDIKHIKMRIQNEFLEVGNNIDLLEKKSEVF